ncbi:MAG: M28 family peptidase [Bacteroidia bacterium]
MFRSFILYSSAVFSFICFGSLAQNQDTIAFRFSKTITAADLKTHLSVLASDEYEGRETGQKGQKMAAEYIRDHFVKCGIPPLGKLDKGYFQTFPLAVYQPQQININANGQKFFPVKDYYSFSAVLKDTALAINEIVFAGYGINTALYNDFEKLDLKGKTMLILDKEPLRKDGRSIISNDVKLSDWSTNYRRKYFEAINGGVKVMLVADNELAKSYANNEHRINATKMEIQEKNTGSFSAPLVVYITEELANSIINSKKQSIAKLKAKISKTATPYNFTFKTNLLIDVKQEVNHINTENVLGYVEGTDLKDELVVVTGHYDHLGKHDGVVYNGADDDGSGTVAVMEMAQAFAMAKKEGKGPRRSMLFMTVAGEEKGLLGSDYYTRNPVFPLEKTVCDLNIDMIGRIDEAHKGNANYIYLIGADKLSKELHNLSEQMNKTYSNLQLDYTYNDEKDPNRYYYRSDHYNFAKNNIPVIFYFNGVHEDYHKETDEVSKIDFNKMEKITRLVFFTAWEIANRTERLKMDVKK